MVTFTETGQTTRAVTWEDGGYDQPPLVLLSCDVCGSAVPSTRTQIHTKWHAS